MRRSKIVVKFKSKKFLIFDKRKVIFWFSFFRNHFLGIYFRWVRLVGGESESEGEEGDNDYEGKVGRIGRPKHSEIGRRC
jgi:hypothetical protein